MPLISTFYSNAVGGWDSAFEPAKASNNDNKPVVLYLQAINIVKSMNESQVDEICETHSHSSPYPRTTILNNAEILRTTLVDEKVSQVVMLMTALIRNLGSLTASGVF